MKGKPHIGTQGQHKGSVGSSPNRAGGGAPGQKVGGTKNSYKKPHYGTQGQKKAG